VQLQELEQRLKAADESAAAAQAEHCNAMWLKGQVEGLRGLNEALQAQLDEMGQELELRTAQVEELQLLLQRWVGLVLVMSVGQVAGCMRGGAAAVRVLLLPGRQQSLTKPPGRSLLPLCAQA
jgi:hypothetical protein